MEYSADAFGDILQRNNDIKILVMKTVINDDHDDPFPSFLFFDKTTEFVDNIFREFTELQNDEDDLCSITWCDYNRSFSIYNWDVNTFYKVFKNYDDIKVSIKSRRDRLKREYHLQPIIISPPLRRTVEMVSAITDIPLIDLRAL